MKHPSKEQIRVLAFAGILLTATGSLFDVFQFPSPTPEESAALEWNYWNALIPYTAQITIWALVGSSTLVGVIGFILFQAWSRWLLLGSMALLALTSPFMGLYVARGLGEGLTTIGGLLFMFPFVLSFFPPCSDYYNVTANK